MDNALTLTDARSARWLTDNALTLTFLTLHDKGVGQSDEAIGEVTVPMSQAGAVQLH